MYTTLILDRIKVKLVLEIASLHFSNKSQNGRDLNIIKTKYSDFVHSSLLGSYSLFLGKHFGSLLFLLKIFQLEVSTVLDDIQL